MSAPVDDPMDEARALALGHPTRFRVFRQVAAAPEPVDVAALAAAVGIHANAVRKHLDLLLGAGLVVVEVEQRTTRGRPRHLYRAAPASAANPYEDLALLLAEVHRSGDTPREVGRRAGRAEAAGREGSGLEGVSAVLARHGFATHVDDDGDIVFDSCPFASVAAADPGGVCQLHGGLAEGAAEVTGAAVGPLVPDDPHTAGCVLRARRQPQAD